MGNLKRVMISLPSSLLKEVDGIVKKEHGNRSQFIREAMQMYIAERQKKELREKMKQGYIEMGQINLELANAGFSVDCGMMLAYEENLAECE
ncbi:CopG family transcriptional regulator [Anoxybacter fermentans]|uniref:CopG family transcriptional regulator n=1 Tax=Anoxybacter fermentans TaxID=1323375 RepID=A0A3Q9HNH2_9FIRM|nr:ribbon-helix-helix protein, CopG family [Anoxybacter fermentans]AZR71980.1 CopG family transcriptional regulator [Anoxybacter fermentans]